MALPDGSRTSLFPANQRVDDLGGIEQARKALKYLEELG
jgi:hypothetical protein